MSATAGMTNTSGTRGEQQPPPAGCSAPKTWWIFGVRWRWRWSSSSPYIPMALRGRALGPGDPYGTAPQALGALLIAVVAHGTWASGWSTGTVCCSTVAALTARCLDGSLVLPGRDPASAMDFPRLYRRLPRLLLSRRRALQHSLPLSAACALWT